MKNDGWDKGFHKGGLIIVSQKWKLQLLFLLSKGDMASYSRRLGSLELFTSLRGRKLCSCHKRLRVVHGSPSAGLGLVAEEGIPVGTAECLSMNKAGCHFTLQSLIWDPGFCTQHFLLPVLAGWASSSPAPPRGGCVSVGPHEEGGVVCHEQAPSR